MVFPGLTVVSAVCAWWPQRQRQVVALSWELPACCACALGRERSRQTTVSCCSQFPLLQYSVAQMSISQKPVVQLDPKCCNHVPVPQAAMQVLWFQTCIYVLGELALKGLANHPTCLLHWHCPVLLPQDLSSSLIFFQLKSPVYHFRPSWGFYPLSWLAVKLFQNLLVWGFNLHIFCFSLLDL